jgi:uncharacterized protein
MASMSQTQFRIAIAASILLYGAAVTSTVLWLLAKSEDTQNRRLAITPSVTQFLPGKEPVVPSSWEQQPAPEAEAMPKANAPLPEMPEPAEAQPVEETPALVPEAKINTDSVLPETPTSEEVVEPAAAVEPSIVQKWQKFARAFDQKDVRPRISLIIADLGLASALTDAAIADLPGDVSLAFSVAASDLEQQTTKARVAGHEIVLAIPMEPENYPQQDPGPNTLLLNLPDQDNVARISRAMAQTEGYVAVMPSMGEKFVTSEQKLTPVLDVVKEQQVIMLDSTLNKNSLIAPLSRLGKIPFTRSDLLVDAASANESFETQLAKLELVAKEKGQAIGIVVPYPSTVDALKAWIATLGAKGIVLAPLTAVASQEIAVPAATESLPQTPKPE